MSLYTAICPVCIREFEFKTASFRTGCTVCPHCGAEIEQNVLRLVTFCPDCHARQFASADAAAPHVCTECGSAFQVLEQSNTVPDHLLSPGDFFDKYRIVRFLGCGGMAEVYRAEHLLLGAPRALKLMKLPEESSDLSRKRFFREARLTCSLVHPNIVKVFDIGCDDKTGYLFIVMEYIDGENLERYAARRQLSERELLEILREMASALNVLGRRGIVHRDIKPCNIMRTRDGVLKLMDLGIAKAGPFATLGNLTLTMERSVFGTPAYSSPEQCRNAHDIDVRSDIYSLGATLYQLASGRIPFDGGTPVETMMKVIHDIPPSLAGLRPDFSVNFVRLIDRMMRKEPEERPHNASELLRMTEEVMKGRSPFAGIFSPLVLSVTALACCMFGVAVLFFVLWMKSPVPSQGISVLAPASSPSSVPVPVPKKVPPVRFSASDFMESGIRTLEKRRDECSRIVEFLKEHPEIPFCSERLAMFESRERRLSEQLTQRELRMREAVHRPLPADLRKKIGTYLQKREKVFQYDSEDAKIGKFIEESLRNRDLDPDVSFADFYGEVRSLSGLVLSGLLEPGGLLLPALAKAGADVNAGLGTVLKQPFTDVRQEASCQKTLRSFVLNGADNIDFYDGSSILLRVLKRVPGAYLPHMRENGMFWQFAEELINSGCNTDVTDGQGRSPAHIAAQCGKTEILRAILLSGSAFARMRDQIGTTPYLYAVRNDRKACVELLTRYGYAHAVAPSDIAQGELFRAIRNKDLALAESALKKGAKLDFLDENGMNMFQLAVLRGYVPMAELLLNYGANVSWTPEYSVPELAVASRNPEMLRMLLKRMPSFDFKIRTTTVASEHLSHSVIIYCSTRPSIACAFYEILLKNGWKINEVPECGSPVLAKAAICPAGALMWISSAIFSGRAPIRQFRPRAARPLFSW
ncbi:protein kinase [bacterium]|nr:protein kinase [bacterium]